MGWIAIIIILIFIATCADNTEDDTNHTYDWHSYDDDRTRREEEEERRRRWIEEEEESRRCREEEARKRAMYDEDDGVFGWDPDHGYWL